MSRMKGALYICARCSKKLFTKCTEGEWGSAYTPVGWSEPLLDMLLCPECSEKWSECVDHFLKDAPADRSELLFEQSNE